MRSLATLGSILAGPPVAWLIQEGKCPTQFPLRMTPSIPSTRLVLWGRDGRDFEVVATRIERMDGPLPGECSGGLETSHREALPEERSLESEGRQWQIELRQLSRESLDEPCRQAGLVVETDHPGRRFFTIPLQFD